MNRKWLFATVFLFLAVFLTACFLWMPSNAQVDFNTEVRPILNKNCLSCHGGVKQSGGFSLLFEEDALAHTDSGQPAIIPGNPAQSEFIRRLTHDDPEERMPQEKDPLSPEEIKVLERWVKQGAKWDRHWAYNTPVREVPPRLKGSIKSLAKNEIDNFIFHKADAAGLQPSPQADCRSLIRRLSLDLIGLPPHIGMVDKFCADPSEEVYVQIVDELLTMPQYGEHWAAMWMDLARYADTKGYERDPHREIWRYRDWLIKAFNQDMPFDQFTIEQLAGDMLPNVKPEQLVATAFHRNTMNNDEGGTNNEYYRKVAVVDRVNTTWEVWQGTSMGCVQCHSHPYDPFRQEEFYQAFDFFNQSADADIFAETPTYRFYQKKDSLKIEQIKDWVRENGEPEEVKEYVDFLHITEPKIHPQVCDTLTNGAFADTKFLVLYEGGFARTPEINLMGKSVLWATVSGGAGGTLQLRLDDLDGPMLGKIRIPTKTRGYVPIPLNTKFIKGSHRIFIRYLHPQTTTSQVTISWMVFFKDLPGEDKPGFELINNMWHTLLNTQTETVPIMHEHSGEFMRTTHVYERGNFDDLGKEVKANVPAIMPALATQVPNRLALAQWLVSPDNPLTARVTVNRFWEKIFGRGIVESLEDFGTMGIPPSHPKLLDWLALEFQENHNWSMKALLKYMVRSATYRQSAEVDTKALQIDPQNRLWARASRTRLSSEQLRDQALATSGLLSKKMYGKSVMPPQPDGIWQVIYNGAKWRTSKGEDRYRRAVYTYWRRTSPYPSFMSFDSPSREVCNSRRINTNTPLQALVTLNDPVYVEAAIHLVKLVAPQKSPPQKAIQEMYEKAILQEPSEKVMGNLLAVYEEAKAYYQQNPEEIPSFFSPIEFELDCSEAECLEWVALSVVANTIMNLDVFVTKS